MGAEGSDPQAENNPVSKGTSEVSHELRLLLPSAPADSHLIQRALEKILYEWLWFTVTHEWIGEECIHIPLPSNKMAFG